MAVTRRRRKHPTTFVLDGSITLAWFFEDETDAYAESEQETLTSAVAIAPPVWRLEIANALLVGERRKRTTAAKSTYFLALLRSLPISIDEEATGRAWTDTLALARTHQLSAYDAAYLESAVRLGLPLATLDKSLRSALRSVGGILYLTS